MKRFAILCAITTMALTITACNQTPDTHDADVKAIQDNEAQWNQDYAAKDNDKIVAHYADDAILMVPGTPASSGKEAIRTALKPMVADPALSLKFHATKVEVAKSGDVAYTQGTYTLTLTDPQTRQVINDHGTYVTTYRNSPTAHGKRSPTSPPPKCRHPLRRPATHNTPVNLPRARQNDPQPRQGTRRRRSTYL